MMNDPTRHLEEEPTEPRQDGSALLVAVLLLVFMGMIGLAAMDTVSRDQQVTGFEKRSRIAFYAAEAGAHTGLDILRGRPNRFTPPAITVTSLGTAADYPYTTQPQFTGDLGNSPCTPARALCWTRDGPPTSIGMKLPQGGNTGFLISYWQVNSLGTGPNGGSSSVEVGKRDLNFSGYGG